MASVVEPRHGQRGPMHLNEGTADRDWDHPTNSQSNDDPLRENDQSLITNQSTSRLNNEDDDSNTSDQNRNGPLPTPAQRRQNLSRNGPGGNGGIPTAVAVPIPESRKHLAYKYVLFSLFVAFLAIVSPSSRCKLQEQQQQQGQNFSSMSMHTKPPKTDVEYIARAAATSSFPESLGTSGMKLFQSNFDNANVEVALLSQDGSVVVKKEDGSDPQSSGGSSLFFQNKEREHPRPFKDLGKSKKSENIRNRLSKTPQGEKEVSSKSAFSPSRWLFPEQAPLESDKQEPVTYKNKKNRRGKRDKEESTEKEPEIKSFGSRLLDRFIDPALLEWIVMMSSNLKEGNPTTSSSRNISETLTQIADKILRSTPRLLSLANLLLAVTYLLHSTVVTLFLGEGAENQGHRTAANTPPDPRAPIFEIGGVGASTSSRLHRSGRERLGGYLLFKLLLISAVVDPDTLDLLILLSWYTLLSFLRSLAYLAGVTTTHALAAGQAPRRGVLKLLLAVLVCDLTAAGVCAALFHGAGWGMVLLLTCDCALLALDILNHVARYGQQVIDEAHQSKIAEMEASQIELHETWRINNSRQTSEELSLNGSELNLEVMEEDLDRASRQMDHEMELLEAIHTRRLALMDYTAFLFELLGLVLTTIHFIHIWSLHGVNFTLVDGVLALHLHSAIASTGKKITERRNHNRIVRDLDSFFEDATELELSKAGATGDVCCICLGTMSIGNVKKVGCGHLFHANCLREVVERARSIEAARCPLCRASLIDGKQVCSHTQQNNVSPFPFFFSPTNNDGGQNVVDDVAVGDGETNRFPIIPATNQDERALFRFSTEGIFPLWLPIPAFSFEVVRRTSADDDAARSQQQQQQQDPTQQDNNQNNAMPPERQQRGGQSFWRRFLLLTGAISMSPEEEAIAIAQLVDMFPQYNREDLLRALRQQGSSETVAESILNGSFLGVIREGSIPDVGEPARVPQQEEGTWDPTDLY